MMMKNILKASYLIKTSQRGFTAKVTLPTLPYELNGLEPVISAKLLDFHLHKHHKAYVDNLNAKSQEAEEALKNGDLRKLTSLTQAIKFHGGGHFNHSFFWENLAPIKQGGGHRPEKGTDLHDMLTH
jgi:Fe-Mn family superoxide dismutase